MPATRRIPRKINGTNVFLLTRTPGSHYSQVFARRSNVFTSYGNVRYDHARAERWGGAVHEMRVPNQSRCAGPNLSGDWRRGGGCRAGEPASGGRGKSHRDPS